MARSTGPVLAAGTITVANRVILHQEPVDWRIVTATGLTAAALALMEKGLPELAVGLSWMALLTILIARVDPKVPSPAESFVEWWNKP
jgi:hypothetical protein